MPTEERVAEFAALLEDSRNLPVLVHGQSVDHAAAMWALYRASRGVPAEIALDEGLTAGLAESTHAVRRRLGLDVNQ